MTANTTSETRFIRFERRFYGFRGALNGNPKRFTSGGWN